MHERAILHHVSAHEARVPILPATGPEAWTPIVLSGGRSTRLGQDKATTTLKGRTLLAHVLQGLVEAGARRVVIVGAQPPATDLVNCPLTVQVCREEVPGSGPVAGLAAGLALVTSEWLALLATDMPLAAGVLPDLLRHASVSPTADVVCAVDTEGVAQPLAAVYRTAAVRSRLATFGATNGASLRRLLAGLHVHSIAIEGPWRLADIDTPADLQQARRDPRISSLSLVTAAAPLASERAAAAPPIHRAPPTGILRPNDERTTMETTVSWLSKAAQALGIDSSIDIQTVLDVARDVAHGVERPAAPLTTYLLGVAVGRGADPAEAAATLRDLLGGATESS